MLRNQTDVAVDEELEKVIITIYSSTETDIGDNVYSSGESTETSSETEAWTSNAYCSECFCRFSGRVHVVPDVYLSAAVYGYDDLLQLLVYRHISLNSEDLGRFSNKKLIQN